MRPGSPSASSLTALLLLACATACGEPPPAATPPPRGAYEAEIEAWRGEREADLRREDGWLSLAGLFWPDEGESTLGSDPGSDLVFPAGAPALIGTLDLGPDENTFSAAPGAEVTAGGDPITRTALQSDAGGEPTVLEVGRFRFHLIERGGRIAVRLRDTRHPTLRSFAGVDHYPVDPNWRIEARFEAYEPPRVIAVPNALGGELEESCPGAAVFTHGGQELRLEPTSDSEGGLFLVFGDTTNGADTYGGGRFLHLPPPVDGRVVLDFNKAYNPPCVFTPWATCPLPPPQNRLPVPVTAGERAYRSEGRH